MTKTHYIYIITDPRNGNVIYVGETTNLRKRRNSHLFHARHGSGQPVHKTMHIMIDGDAIPVISSVDEITTEHQELAFSLERWWEEKLCHEGHLLNLCNERCDGRRCRRYERADFGAFPDEVKRLAGASIEEVDAFFMDEMQAKDLHICAIIEGENANMRGAGNTNACSNHQEKELPDGYLKYTSRAGHL